MFLEMEGCWEVLMEDFLGGVVFMNMKEGEG